MKQKIDMPNSEIERRISELIHSKRDRTIMRMKLIHGMSNEAIAEKVSMSPVQVQRITQRETKMILK